MALRAVFDRTPREAPKFLSLRGLRAFSRFLRVKNLLACLIAVVASPQTLGVASALHRARRGEARFVALVRLRHRPRYVVCVNRLNICDKYFPCLWHHKASNVGRNRPRSQTSRALRH
jgi:hypothetical protein